ncbi:MAG: glutaminase [Deltaproteobacteria bacterium]|nr:glutaminase [Deltaproteobacteria bacterium]
MPTIFNLDPILRQVASAKNKNFVKELQSEGMREETIDRILLEDYKQNIYSYPLFPRAKILECKKDCRSLSYSMRKINSLLDDGNILNVTKERLLKEEYVPKVLAVMSMEGLYQNTGDWMYTVEEYLGPGDPKSWKQMVGFQIRMLYDYIKPFSESANEGRLSRQRDYRSQDVFELIKELLNIFDQCIAFKSWKQIKTMYGNAKKHKGGPSPKRIIGRSKLSVFEWGKIQKAR